MDEDKKEDEKEEEEKKKKEEDEMRMTMMTEGRLLTKGKYAGSFLASFEKSSKNQTKQRRLTRLLK